MYCDGGSSNKMLNIIRFYFQGSIPEALKFIRAYLIFVVGWLLFYFSVGWLDKENVGVIDLLKEGGRVFVIFFFLWLLYRLFSISLKVYLVINSCKKEKISFTEFHQKSYADMNNVIGEDVS